MISFCTLCGRLSSRTAPRTRFKLVIRCMKVVRERKWTQTEKERKRQSFERGKTRRMKQRRGSGICGLCEHHKAPGRDSIIPFALFHFVFNSSQFHYCQASPARHAARRDVVCRAYEKPRDGSHDTSRRSRLLLSRCPLIANST